MPYKNKCFSTCRKRAKSECNHPQCRYNNGKQYQYCRLSHSYKMNEACKPELRERIKKGTRKAKTPITILEDELPLSFTTPPQVGPDEEFVTPPDSVTKESIKEFRERIKKANATRKIKKFFKKHQNKRRAHFLKAICSDADVCMAFGTEAAKIKKHFDNFDNFDLLSKPAQQIGSPSANGFVKDLTYERDGYVANAILKSSASDHADNLLYEGLVGKFLNKKGKQFPCFVETYGIYLYDPNDPAAYFEMRTNKLSDPMVLKTGLSKLHVVHPVHLSFACKHSLYVAVLIQHLRDAQPFKMMLDDNKFISEDLLNVLYQVYMPLAMLSTEFTHYDLHYNNVLLYEPVKGKYIHYHYHRSDYVGGGPPIITSFKCKYIAKIIDYGRCYFNDKENRGFTGSSNSLYTEVCSAPECIMCGRYTGFGKLTPRVSKDLAIHSFICSQKSNQSHDLRFLYMTRCELKKRAKTFITNASLLKVLEKVIYGAGIPLDKEDKEKLKNHPNQWIYYGTKENLGSGLPRSVNNISDAYSELERLMSDSWIQAYNDIFYAPLSKLGDLHIYDDGRPMRYVPA
uniref:Protein kinase domain-containing protein n=1 Tax=viral metagenome TaxID=1070528 RepID=A0A6C0JZP3_9ZZZZ